MSSIFLNNQQSLAIWEHYDIIKTKMFPKRISKNVYAKTREECVEKLAELIKTMKAEIAEVKKQAKNA